MEEKGILYLKQVEKNGEVFLITKEEVKRKDAIIEIDKVKRDYKRCFTGLYLLNGNIKIRFKMRTVIKEHIFLLSM